jgi:hypothetical protein
VIIADTRALLALFNPADQASIVVLAKRFKTTSILTLDHRHFGVIRSLDGAHFTLYP